MNMGGGGGYMDLLIYAWERRNKINVHCFMCVLVGDFFEEENISLDWIKKSR